MSHIRRLLASALGVLALSVTAAPVAQAQPLPGGSLELPPIEPISLPVPIGSTASQLPPLPFPLFWQDPVPPPPPAPRFVASNWVVPYTGCHAPYQRAYAQDGTQLWCSQLDRTDAFMWAPHPTSIPYPAPRPPVGHSSPTAVANSLGAKPCPKVGDRAIDPSNGQEAYCAWQRVGIERLIWQYEPGS